MRFRKRKAEDRLFRVQVHVPGGVVTATDVDAAAVRGLMDWAFALDELGDGWTVDMELLLPPVMPSKGEEDGRG